MRYYADLHIHSRYSRATSRDCDLEHLALWARRKGISVLGTGDFTHPAWRAEIREKLVPAEPGLFRLRPDLEMEVERATPAACALPTRFLLSVEISTIYKKGPRTRKVHHLIYVPDFAAADRVALRLARIGNLHSDGRPILGLDSRHLLEIVLESDPGSYLIPAHVWTPWFSVLGSKAGFDSVEECYDDLARHVFALETGLSSDPAMNWRISHLDRFRLVSNSDAHSPQKLGREACLFDTELDYFGLRRALETGQGYVGTVEFFPEEGKYHIDGHRKCDVRWSPQETRAHGGRCTGCGSPVTVGVLSRVEDLADREEGAPPPATAGEVRSLVPLPEILGEIQRTGPASSTVDRSWRALTERLGPELTILGDVPLDDIRRAGSAQLAEAIGRLRRGEVQREAGFDGEYGRIRLFRDDELRDRATARVLFDLDEPVPAEPETRAPMPPAVAPRPLLVMESAPAFAVVDGLDADQRAAVEAGPGALLLIAGPGSGKTRTLTHRIARLVREAGVPASQCLAITFTRRAADEMRERLRALLSLGGDAVAVHTFHSLGHTLLRRHAAAAGLREDFEIADEALRLERLELSLGLSGAEARRFLSAFSRAKRRRDLADDARFATYQAALREAGALDFDDLVAETVALLERHPDVVDALRAECPWVFVDEYQDVDELQYELLRQLVPSGGNVCAVGDPDQAIYSFRGADVRFFHRFEDDFPGARRVRLARNYRSLSTIVDASRQMLSEAQELKGDATRTGERVPIVLHEAASERAEAEFVVSSVERTIGGHNFFSVDTGRSGDGLGDGIGFADVAILYRTEAQAPPLVEALARSGLPFQHRSHERLVEHPGVLALLPRLRGDGAGPLEERLDAAVKEYGPGVVELERGRELLRALLLTCGGDAERFWSELPAATEADTWEARADRISLLTLHAAKGLEFRIVFIAGCEDGLLPLRFGEHEAAPREEERRLFYVGMTRAKDRLFLCHARRRLLRGRVIEPAPSPFLAAIDEPLLAHERAATRKPRARGDESRQGVLF